VDGVEKALVLSQFALIQENQVVKIYGQLDLK
jgi:hypothetical protein